MCTIKSHCQISLPQGHREELGLASPPPRSVLCSDHSALEVFASSSSGGRRAPGLKLSIPKRAPGEEHSTEKEDDRAGCED